MQLKELKDEKYLVCARCGYKVEAKKERVVVKEEIPEEDTKKVIVFGKKKESEQLPTTKILCPNCGNDEAYWWVQQTRSADEPPTTFYKCKKCNYTWRSYG